MASCKLVNRLYDAIPVPVVRDLLLRTHIEKCARCQAALLSREEAMALFVKPRDVGGAEEIWQRVGGTAKNAAGRAGTGTETRMRGPLWWQWAAGAATLIVAVAVGFWLLDNVERSGPGLSAGTAPTPAGFEIKYVNVGGEPAQAFIYQPQGSETVFVWASKTP